MVIKMARKAGAFFFVNNLMSCITVAKQPCYGLLKIKLSNNIVRYYVIIKFIYYGGSQTAMDAMLANIVSGRASN